ncbi:MAG: YceI family protein [Ekhidna sp.]
MFFLSLLLFNSVFLQDPSLNKASISFEIMHMGVLKVEGKFDGVSGEIRRLGKNDWVIEGEVDVQSIDTGNAARDQTILGPQYLDVESHPVIPFVAQMKIFEEKGKITVDLEIRGLKLKICGAVYEVGGKLVSNRIRFKRSDMGLDFGLMDSLVGNEITFIIDSGIALSKLKWLKAQ